MTTRSDRPGPAARTAALLARLAPRTLRGRLSLVALTAATLLMVILTVAFNTVVRRHLEHQADDELRARAAAVATTIDTRGPKVASWRPTTMHCSTRTYGSTPAGSCSNSPPRPRHTGR